MKRKLQWFIAPAEMTAEDLEIRNRNETLESARERLCQNCQRREIDEVPRWNGATQEMDYRMSLGCKSLLDPRCADGNDCPYYTVDTNALSKSIIKRMVGKE